MFDIIAAAAIEVTLAAVVAPRHTYALCHFGPLNRLLALEHDGAGFIAA